jgi:hypothetical protein
MFELAGERLEIALLRGDDRTRHHAPPPIGPQSSRFGGMVASLAGP